MKVLVTGATGFIGKALSQNLRNSGFDLRVAVRQRDIKLPIDYEVTLIGDIGPQTDWQKALIGVDAVIHLAGLAHMLGDTGNLPLVAFRKVNALGTERLARMAAEEGVKRFIFISSIKVNGEGALQAYNENDIPAPRDAYGISKREAEEALGRIAAETSLETVVLRIPLVYGAGVKANFRNLIKIAGVGLPLPLKGINNQRSFLYLGNLTDAISICITHPLAAGETFMVSDGQDISTPDLIKMIACAMGKKAVLFTLPFGVLKALCRIVSKSEELEKLTGTLIVDSNKIKNLLGWKPPFTLEEGIRETVKGIALPARRRPLGAPQRQKMVKRTFDLILALVLAVLLSIPMLVIVVLVKLMSKGPAIFWTDRVGVRNGIFKMAKFRTMKLSTPQVATHLMRSPEIYLIPFGAFLRKYSLDEIPQLFNILKGDMSFVGPRPALFNQGDLVALRTEKNIHTLIPGITGWAQVNGRDDLSIPVKVSYDEYYLKHRSFAFDLHIIFLTVLKVIKKEGIQH